MGTTYRDADAAGAIAQDLIRDHHRHLRDSAIRYLLRTGGEWKKGGKECWSSSTILSGATQHVASNVDVILIVNAEVWEALRVPQRTALIDHELSHLEPQVTSAGDIVTNPATGRPLLRTVAHDVEEFAAVIERHGLWRPDLEMVGGIVRARAVSMFEDGAAEAEAESPADGREEPKITDVEVRGPDGDLIGRANVAEIRRAADEVTGRPRRQRKKRSSPVEA